MILSNLSIPAQIDLRKGDFNAMFAPLDLKAMSTCNSALVSVHLI